VKYMLLIYEDPNAEYDPKVLDEYWAFTDEIAQSGELISGEPLQGIDTATAVRVRAGETTTTDGPFAETKEWLGGYYLVDCKDLDRAIELAAKIPSARSGTVEVRPLREFTRP